MTAKDVLNTAFQMNHMILSQYLSDLSDADLLIRPVPAANRIAWQLGHLIVSEGHLLAMIPGAKPASLPAGFAEQHDKAAAASESTAGFRSKKDYLDLLTRVREATLATLNNLSDADLDKPIQGDMARFAPTAGAMLFLIANHEMMHAGQFVVTRRKLGKPILM